MPNIQRFIDAQEKAYDLALSEIKSGRKQSHWIWYIFPQIKGLGYSFNSNFYGIDGIEEAREYISNNLLRHRLVEICKELLLHDVNINEILGGIDSQKLKSSMTLFDIVMPDDIFSSVLEKFFDGKRCHRTLTKINKK